MNTTLHWLTTALDGIVAFLPNLVAGLIILLVGWIVGAVLAQATRALARRLRFHRLWARLGVNNAEPAVGARWLGSTVFAVVMLVAVLQASRVWKLDFVSNGLAAIIAYLPHVLAAAVVFGVALFIGNWIRDRFYRARAATSETETGISTAPRILPAIVRAAVIGVGAFMALRELQIAPEIVNAAFMLTLGAVAVAGALAFGLGAREVAGRVAQSWWERRSLIGISTPPSRRADVTV